MAEFAIGLGANLGDRIASLEQALRALGGHPNIKLNAVSRLYESAPWGITDQPAFFNACAMVESHLSPSDLLSVCLTIEQSMGRVRETKWGPRLIDIDIVCWSGPDIQTDRLTLPHPFAHQRAFVLRPLMGIAPNLLLNGETLATYLARLPEADTNSLQEVPHTWLIDIEQSSG